MKPQSSRGESMSNDKKILDLMYSITSSTTSEELRDIYDQWADHYEHDLVDAHQYAMPARAAALAATRLIDRNIAVLDVGCGTGLSGLALQAQGFTNLDGCDLSPGMLAIAQERAIYGHLFEVDLLAPPMAIADGHYDLTIAVGAFATGHLGGPAIDELLRITKQSGTLIVTTNDHFYETGVLQEKFAELQQESRITGFLAEHGDHIPGKNIGGWVFSMSKV